MTMYRAVTGVTTCRWFHQNFSYSHRKKASLDLYLENVQLRLSLVSYTPYQICLYCNDQRKFAHLHEEEEEGGRGECHGKRRVKEERSSGRVLD